MTTYLTTDEVAQRFSLTTARVRQLARRGVLPALKVGALWRFPNWIEYEPPPIVTVAEVRAGVYFVEAVAGAESTLDYEHVLIKVGHSTHIAKRLNSLITGSPFPLRLMHIIDNATTEDEASWHNLLSKFNTRGEWFAVPVELANLIEVERPKSPSHIELGSQCLYRPANPKLRLHSKCKALTKDGGTCSRESVRDGFCGQHWNLNRDADYYKNWGNE